MALIVVGFIFFANVWTDVLWYQQLGFFEVFLTENLARIAIFLAGFAVMFTAVFFAIRIAYHARPVYAPDSDIRDNLNRYQVQLEPVRRVVMVGLPILFGLFAGSAAASQWQKVLLFLNQEAFGQNDPQFGLDISFYLMTLPFLGFVTGFLISVTIVAGLAGILTHYLYGSIRIMERGIFTSRAAQIHLAVTGAAFLLLLGVNFWLDRYAAVQNNGGRWAGALYTDVNAVIPTKSILAVAAVLVAVLFIVAAVIGKWRLPVIGTAMLVITSILAGGVYPWVIQQFQVRPSEQTLEKQYIERNIDMTRAAYGLDKIQEKRYNATTDATTGALAPDAETTANIRLLDPNLISDAFSQLEQYRPYYQFPERPERGPLRDRRQDPGHRHRRPRAQPGRAERTNQQSWLNRHVVYTHGYGVVAAKGNKFTVDGKPEFLQAGIPSTGVLGDDSTYQPRVYFGENSPDYSIVGAPDGAPHREQDRPAGQGRRRRNAVHLHRRRRPERRQLLQQAPLRDQVPVLGPAALRRRERRVADPLRPQPAGPRREGRPVPDRGRQRLPGRRRRPGEVDRGRLHHQPVLPVLPAGAALRGHGRLADRPRAGRSRCRTPR